MEQALIPTPLYANVLGFLRFRGVRGEWTLGANIGPRAEDLLERLSAPRGSLRFWLALRDTLHEDDLLWDEFANDPRALTLQVRVLELAQTYKSADDHWRSTMGMEISTGIVANIIMNCVDDSCEAARIIFGGGDSATVEWLKDGEWVHSGQLPREIWPSVLGTSRRFAAASSLMKPYLATPVPPAQFKFIGTPVNEIIIRPEAAV